jgi:hypothetical protein
VAAPADAGQEVALPAEEARVGVLTPVWVHLAESLQPWQ